MILLVGTGYMAREYAKILSILNTPFVVVGRGEKNAMEFEGLFPGISVYRNGINNFNQFASISKVIIATSVDSLFYCAMYAINNGIKKILIEKPGGVNSNEIELLKNASVENGASVYLGYNRRFYQSIIRTKELIINDGGVTSFNFEFTEWSNVIESLEVSKIVKENWLLANSSHVLDTAFYLGGRPDEFTSYITSSTSWHPSGAIFSGSGKAKNGALFSYKANWNSAGRWGIEILTKKRKIILSPLEKIKTQLINSLEVLDFSTNYKIDEDFKPGVYLQLENFLNENYCEMCDIVEQYYSTVNIYNKIAGYQS